MTASTTTTTVLYAELAAAVRGGLIMPGDAGYDRLAQARRRYDPDNTFRVNQ